MLKLYAITEAGGIIWYVEAYDLTQAIERYMDNRIDVPDPIAVCLVSSTPVLRVEK